MTNPPSVPSLDVEACVRLLNNIASDLDEDGYCTLGPVEKPYIRALASALPGMGKAMEENESLRRDAERWRSRRKRPCLGTNGRMCLLEPGHEGPHKPPPVEPDIGSDL